MRITVQETRAEKCIYAFCDESSQTAHRYLVLGCIFFVPADPKEGESLCSQIEVDLADVKQKHGLGKHELKWERVPNPGQYLEGYKRLIDFYLDNEQIYFRCMVLDTHEYSLRDKFYMDGDQELGYRKFLCVFLADSVMKWKYDYFFEIRVDDKSTRDDYTFEQLEEITNGRFIKRAEGSAKYTRHCHIQAVESKSCNAMQVADILTGAVAAKWNGKAKKRGKLELISYLEERIGHDLSQTTPASWNRFNVWKIRPNPRAWP